MKLLWVVVVFLLLPILAFDLGGVAITAVFDAVKKLEKESQP